MVCHFLEKVTMDEFIGLGHMRPLSQLELQDRSFTSNYIPHQEIWQRSNNGLKLRVVFNAPRPTSSGCSLNDVLYAGPNVQNDLAVVVTATLCHGDTR